jgi:DNA-binding response OmpR family regulator
MAKILIVEDEVDLAELVGNWLRKENHLVEVATHGDDALLRLRINKYDLLILDVMLPGANGFDICQQFRRSMGSSPVLMLTAKNSVRDKALGLDLGADDYMTKPFDLVELAARVRALLRRGVTGGERYCIGEVIVELGKRRVVKNGAEVRLLPQEYRLLEFFVRHSQHFFSPEELLESVWESDTNAMVDTVRGHIQRLRKKLDSKGSESIIETVYGLGYKVEAIRC